jgi:hypothetical protein
MKKLKKRIPTDKDIDFEMSIRNYDAEYRKAFEHGAKWLRNKIIDRV